MRTIGHWISGIVSTVVPGFVILLAAESPALAGARDLRVKVTLNSGGKLDGIVRDGALYERIVDGQFVRTSSAEVPGAGFRLWNVSESAGFFFVKYSDVRDFKTLSPTDTVPVAESEKSSAEKKSAKKASGAGSKTGATKGAPKRQLPALTDEEVRLLVRFPPALGYSPEKKLDLEQRSVVVGAFPSPEELEWLRNYDAWLKAYEHWLADEPKPASKPVKPKAGAGGAAPPKGQSGANAKSSDPKLGVDGRPEKERA